MIKAENPHAYKELASKGLMLGHPVKIRGQAERSDIGIPYHSSIKFFNTDKESPEQVHDVAHKLKMNPPDPKQTHIKPNTFKDRFGNDVHVIELHGPHAEEMKSHHNQFSHMGHKQNFEYQPHVSVDKATWEKIKSSGAKTAHEAGMEFGHAQIRHGHNVTHDYSPKIKKSEDLSLDIIRDTVKHDFNLKKSYWKAIYLSDEYLNNYLNDNPTLKKSAEESHKRRIESHFKDNKELANIAWEKGIKHAYEKLKGK